MFTMSNNSDNPNSDVTSNNAAKNVLYSFIFPLLIVYPQFWFLNEYVFKGVGEKKIFSYLGCHIKFGLVNEYGIFLWGALFSIILFMAVDIFIRGRDLNFESIRLSHKDKLPHIEERIICLKILLYIIISSLTLLVIVLIAGLFYDVWLFSAVEFIILITCIFLYHIIKRDLNDVGFK